MPVKYKLLSYVIYLFGLFPILPNKVSGLPVILLFILSLTFLTKKINAFPLKKTLLFSGLYILYLISLFYSNHFNGIDKTLSTRLSLLVIPLSFGLINTQIKDVSLQIVHRFLILFILSTLTFGIYNTGVIYLNGFSMNDVNPIYNYLTHSIPLINTHPIYSAIFFSLALSFSVYFLFIFHGIKNKIIFSFVSLIFLFFIFFLARKGVIISLFVSIFLLLFIRLKSKQKKFIPYFLIVFVGTISFFLLLPKDTSFKKRFHEMIDSKSFNSINENNSTSIRYGIYKSALHKMQEKLIFGHGLGDVDFELNNYYRNYNEHLFQKKYNSHNQYFSIILSLGLLGLVYFLLYLSFCLKKALFTKNYLLLFIVVFYSLEMLFENILERQSGVILFVFLITFMIFLPINKVATKVHYEK